ncbi:HEAT repeat domain-containing protein [Actinoplanes sp. NPDC023714]|uniref:HEAT repeat domain-containing protein n=1 Tax=Actinoplanes sp. NPDC023714 TaxID=3154322 RepID=UPI0033CB85F9
MTTNTRAIQALASANPSTRLQAALALGTNPDHGYVGSLVDRCAIEPDFFVRENLTWALTRHPPELTVPRLVEELRSANPRARSQALHTLSKIGDSAAWPAITPELIADPDDEVARAAWRAAVVLAPATERPALAGRLRPQLGRGVPETQLSLSRALLALADAALPVLQAARNDPDPAVRQHAIATERLARDPDAGFALAIEEAKRIVALDGAPAGEPSSQGAGVGQA